MLFVKYKYIMNDAYTNAFFGIVREAQETSGYELPIHLEHYVVMVLAIHIDKPTWHPEKSFAEAYMSISNKSSAKDLGDTCLFVSGVFPSFGSRKGLKRSYFQSIGKNSYNQITGEIFQELSLHFDFLSDFIDLTINTPKTHDLLFPSNIQTK